MGHGIQGTPSEQRSAVISSSAWILKEEKESYETRALATNQTRLLFIVERMESPRGSNNLFYRLFLFFCSFSLCCWGSTPRRQQTRVILSGRPVGLHPGLGLGVGWETRTRDYHNTLLSLNYGHGRHQRSLGVETTGLVYYYLHITQCGR